MRKQSAAHVSKSAEVAKLMTAPVPTHRWQVNWVKLIKPLRGLRITRDCTGQVVTVDVAVTVVVVVPVRVTSVMVRVAMAKEKPSASLHIERCLNCNHELGELLTTRYRRYG